MKEIGFSELFTANVHFSGIAAVHRKWSSGNKNNYLTCGRDENILSFTLSGAKNIYTASDSTPLYTLKAPAIVLITQNAPYLSETVTTSGQLGETVCIRFKMSDDFGQPLILKEHWLTFSGDNNGYIADLFFEVLQAYLKPEANMLRIKIAFYKILLALHEQIPCVENDSKFEMLQPAIQHIRQNPCDNLPVCELARLCNLSESYFRSCFKKYSGGQTLTDYRNRLRIEKAEELLQSSLWTTELIAETLGFFDTSHFYRVYKKITGKTPRNKL